MVPLMESFNFFIPEVLFYFITQRRGILNNNKKFDKFTVNILHQYKKTNTIPPTTHEFR